MAINILDSSIYNRISAGEVVEKPSSVVKELVENSIDAKAKNIRVLIYGGGIKKIAVFDDGDGIDSCDIKKAFLPHATSKIQNVKDLDCIESLGFRGEALASIASVSCVKLISKTKDEEVASLIELEGGKFTNEMKVASTQGTSIYVSNLFFNTPVRYKFLKKPKFEENDITSIMQKFILSNLLINFEYVVDDKLIYKTFSSNLSDRLKQIYGEYCGDNLIEINKEKEGLKLKGFIGNEQLAKPNRLWQNLFVNGRYVVNDLISRTIFNAFGEHLMKGQYPFYSLFLSIDPINIDVNVHPSKREIKFENESLVCNFVFETIAEAIHINQSIKTIDCMCENNKPLYIDKLSNAYSSTINESEGVSFDENNTENKQNNIVLEFSSSTNVGDNKLNEVKIEVVDFKPITKEKPTVKNDFHQERISLFSSFKKIGVLFNTYIILEYNDCAYIIDQHAAHERINYNNLMNSKNDIASQLLSVPFVYDMGIANISFFEQNLKEFLDLGFDLSLAGEHFIRVDAIPSNMKNIDLTLFFNMIFSDIGFVKGKASNIIRNHFATIACKASVKGGDELADIEIDYLLKEIGDENVLLLCPHGRPVIIKLKKEDLEKWFKRII